MSVFIIVGLWLCSWIFTIILSAIATKFYNNDIRKYGEDYIEIVPYQSCKQEMIADANNLFPTGILYTILFAICYFVKNNILSYICIGVGFIFCIPSIISWCKALFTQMIIVKNRYITLMTISAMLCVFIPLIIALSIYFLIILK